MVLVNLFFLFSFPPVPSIILPGASLDPSHPNHSSPHKTRFRKAPSNQSIQNWTWYHGCEQHRVEPFPPLFWTLSERALHLINRLTPCCSKRSLFGQLKLSPFPEALLWGQISSGLPYLHSLGHHRSLHMQACPINWLCGCQNNISVTTMCYTYCALPVLGTVLTTLFSPSTLTVAPGGRCLFSFTERRAGPSRWKRLLTITHKGQRRGEFRSRSLRTQSFCS